MTIWFLMAAHGRFDLTAICMRQLARTCEALSDAGRDATAVVVADQEPHLDLAAELGFATIDQENSPLGRKWNDGFQFAADPDFNPRPADFVIPIGSDDWVDPSLLIAAPLPADDEMTCFRLAAFVNEDASELARIRVTYPGGLGIRIIPRALIERAGFRPAAEERMRAMDTSVLRGITDSGGEPAIVYYDLHALQIVDWKSRRAQLNPYDACLAYATGYSDHPFDELATVYPLEPLEAMLELYARAG